jgi:hypothetical protein
MPRRVIVTLLAPVRWAPPGVDLVRWRAALAEDVVDLLAMLNEVDPAIAATAADRELADAIAWPTMRVYGVEAPTVNAALAAAAADGYEQAAVVAADAPDVPGLVLGKLLRPLTTRPVAVAAAGEGTGTGLLGLAARLPAPDWLPTLDLEGDALAVRRAAPQPQDVAITAAWRRLRGPAELATLDPAVEGWDATRALLSAR